MLECLSTYKQLIRAIELATVVVACRQPTTIMVMTTFTIRWNDEWMAKALQRYDVDAF